MTPAGGRLRAAAIQALLLLPALVLAAYLAQRIYLRWDSSIWFDYQGHLDYIRFIDATATIPLADRGWQMYHPPLYYLASALVFEGFHGAGSALSFADAARWTATAAWVIQGLVAAAGARALRAGPVAAVVAALVTWMLPPQSIVVANVYNETFADAAIAVMVLGLLVAPARHRTGLALLGFGFAAAVLSKYSGVAAAAVSVPLAAWVLRERLRDLAIALAPGAVLGALYYGRNLLVFHSPFPNNAEIFHQWEFDHTWGRIEPGFWWRWDIGPRAPYDSFFGTTWKWMWGGNQMPELPWPTDLHVSGIAVGIATTLVTFVALAYAVRRSTRGEPAFLALAAVPLVIFVAFAYWQLRFPTITASHGMYLMGALPPAAMAIGLLTGRFVDRRPYLAAAAYLGAFAWSLVMMHASAFV